MCEGWQILCKSRQLSGVHGSAQQGRHRHCCINSVKHHTVTSNTMRFMIHLVAEAECTLRM